VDWRGSGRAAAGCALMGHITWAEYCVKGQCYVSAIPEREKIMETQTIRFYHRGQVQEVSDAP
jgi:xanthine dehydrogenase small subunit